MELRDRSCISGHHFSSWLTILVAVGTGVVSCPPRRSRHTAFPHQAPVEGQTRPAFGAWAAHPGPVRGRWPSGTCGFRLCVRGMRWPLPFLRPFPPRSPPPTRRPVLFEASSVLCGLLRPSGPALAPRLPESTRDRQDGCGRPEVSQVPTRSLTARTGLRLRLRSGPPQNGPAHVACGGSQRLGLHDIEFFGAQYSPRRLAVYASPSPMIPQHSLPGPLPDPPAGSRQLRLAHADTPL